VPDGTPCRPCEDEGAGAEQHPWSILGAVIALIGIAIPFARWRGRKSSGAGTSQARRRAPVVAAGVSSVVSSPGRYPRTAWSNFCVRKPALAGQVAFQHFRLLSALKAAAAHARRTGNVLDADDLDDQYRAIDVYSQHVSKVADNSHAAWDALRRTTSAKTLEPWQWH
jgi:hypothetical protein